MEKWLIQPGDSRVIDVEAVPALKIGLVGGQIDVVAHDEPTIRIEVHSVTAKDLRIELQGDTLEIDHPQLRWDNFLEVFRNFTATGPKADISVAVPRDTYLTLGVVSASALVSGLRRAAKLNTVSGDIMVDGLVGDLSVNAVSGDTQARHLTGAFNANSVSGDVTVTGEIVKASIDTVSGRILVDASGPIDAVSLNTVSGETTVRLDEDLAANYVTRSISGRILVDGVVRSGSGLNGYSGNTGALDGSFVDVRANSVSGGITVVRRSTFVPSEGAGVTNTDEELS